MPPALSPKNLATGTVAGFDTLSSSNVPLTEVPESLATNLPRYPIGSLARARAYAGTDLGEVLLFDAITTVATAPISAHAIFADAIDDAATAF